MKYSSQRIQLSIHTFRSYLASLSKPNHEVQLSSTLPQDEIEYFYNYRLNNNKRNASNKPTHMIISILLIIHKMYLPNEEAILIIQKNPYIQYSIILSKFITKQFLESILYFTICKRLGNNDFNDMSFFLLKIQVKKIRVSAKEKSNNKDGIYRVNIRARLPEMVNYRTAISYFHPTIIKCLKELLHILCTLVELITNPSNNWRKNLPIPELPINKL